ncbi:hypothetical protein K461DRAFT_266400 [Myriangium duriaei CBS 260.36]|uniref:RING-type domain-containing protein n=1 Tax=Myriangium duriaei CBS 260.36 TaxID=1168546 RepID=A0A9P4MPX3_9PEZI|nr:hypothetical protein K461DRAFT_266400 [Myriangium duriaei CBS 260.36]
MAAACILCQDPLVLDVADDSDTESSVNDPKTIPDDVELPCGDHFHWQCLLDAYTSPSCPACSQSITTSTVMPSSSSTSPPTQAEQALVTLTNEGGVQHNLDILPLLTEEAYLRSHPEDRICRAFLELCREGDVSAIVDLLRSCSEPQDDDEDEDEVPRKSASQVLRYQDPLGEGQSGLHAAVAASQREVAWLLLLLASELPELEFPALVYQEAAHLGVMRPEGQTGEVDIRTLRDSKGRTAEDIAAEVGGVWHGWVGSGRLSA